MKFNSKAIHAGQKACPITGAHVTPIYQTSTFVFKDVQQGKRRFMGEEEGYVYTRAGNPTTAELENKMAVLEKGEFAIATASGMAAISTALFTFLKQGDHLIAADTLYGCTYSFIKNILPRFGIEITFVDGAMPENIENAIKDNTKVIYVETPGNPTLKLVDIKAVSEIAHKHNAYLVVDNTFMTPYLQKPLSLGADIVVHSATKYIGGHGDVIAGVIVASESLVMEMRDPFFADIGGVISPFDSWLLLRGIKSLGLRMDKHCKNAQVIAEFLEQHPLVERVYYPGLPTFTQHELAKRQMAGFGGMISFELKGGIEAGQILLNNVKMISLAVSLGCVDSLIQHPATMTHATVPYEERIKAGITDGLIRISIGTEDVEDIIEDLSKALNRIK